MNKSINKLKPKANRLLEFVTSWHLAKPEKNIELSSALMNLFENEKFPEPLVIFFQIPRFQELLETMQEGKLYIPHKDEEETKEEASLHPPLEVQNLQKLAEAFHKLVHLDYNKNKAKDPVVEGKLASENLLKTLYCMDMLYSYDPKITSPLFPFLTAQVRDLATQVEDLLTKHPHLFSKGALSLLQDETLAFFEEACEDNYSSDWMEKAFPVFIHLNLDPLTKDKKGAIANAHKLLNRITSLFLDRSLFYQRTPPHYIPKDIQKEIKERLSSPSEFKELLQEILARDKYQMIEARQLSIQHKMHAISRQINLFTKSLSILIDGHKKALPKAFIDQVERSLPSFSHLLTLAEKPNPIGVQLISGFFTAYYEYLTDLLHEGEMIGESNVLSFKVKELLPNLLSFFELYYSIKPYASFFTIRHLLQTYAEKPNLTNEMIEEAFNLLIPKEVDPVAMEKSFLSAFVPLKDLLPHLEKNAAETNLLIEKLRLLNQIDIPSYSWSWFTFGEILAALFLLGGKKTDQIEKKMTDLFNSRPFLTVTFYPHF